MKRLSDRRLWSGCWISLALLAVVCPDSRADVHLAMGFRVGEVSQTTAIVWVRGTASPQRNEEGKAIVGRAGRRVAEYEPLDVPDDELQGAVPGAAGQVRVTIAKSEDMSNGLTSKWAGVAAPEDYTHQFPLTGLEPATRYYLRAEARAVGSPKITRSDIGSFTTAARPDRWQDVRFTVVTGQAYKDLDDPKGFHIYPSMGSLKPHFIVPTGDTVYYDSEAPRARTVQLARYHWHRMYSLPRIVEFHRHVPGYWEKDDHDTYSNDSWPTLRQRWMEPLTFQDGLRIFREQVPMGHGPTYRTYRWGKGLQIWLVEGRDYRSANNAPDGPEKTIWGKEQLNWLQQSILESDASFRVLVSPTPIVGPDRPNKRDNHSNKNFAHEGDAFRKWTKDMQLENFFVCCGDRHWQYMSVDKPSGLREFSCGPASDQHAGGTPGHDMMIQPYHRVIGGFLSVEVSRKNDQPNIAFRFHDVDGKVVYTFEDA